MQSLYHKIKNLFQKHERWLLPTSLVFGFIVDSITLTRIDKLFDNLVLIGYLVLSGGIIILMYSEKKFFTENTFVGKVYTFLPYILQYAFGGLFSALFVFYSKSSSFITSLPFLLLLLFLLIGNEFFHRKSKRLLFWVTVFSIALMSYSLLIVPVIIRSIGILAFVAGSAIGGILMYLFVRLILKSIPESREKEKNKLYKSIATIFVVFILLYLTNIIPPVPLSLKTAGVFHSVVRSENSYIVEAEKEPWFRPFRESSKTYHRAPGESVFVFSSVFAPTNIKGTIYHQWGYFDKKDGWVETSRIPIKISGGNKGGFRGYSTKSAIFPGSWRVDIENEKGQVAGRLRFEIKDSDQKTPLITKKY